MIANNKDQLIDIYDVWYEPFWLQPWFIIGIRVCLYIGIIILLYFLYKKYIQKTIVVDYIFVAYQDLDQLKKAIAINSSDVKKSYFTLTLIVKNISYIDIQVFLMGLTDKEIMQKMHKIIPEDDVVILQKVLQDMTFIKFEHQIVSNEKLEKDIMLMQKFIQNTTLHQDNKGI